MGKFSCCTGLLRKKNKSKVGQGPPKPADYNSALRTMKIRLEQPVIPSESGELNTTYFGVTVPLDIQKESVHIKVISHETPDRDEAGEVAYEGEDEHDENTSIRRNLSDFDLQVHVANSGEQFIPRSAQKDYSDSRHVKGDDKFENKVQELDEKGNDVIQSGHISDPGTGKAELWGSPMLKRSCSNLETGKVLQKMASWLPQQPHSLKFQELNNRLTVPLSPTSVVSYCSADRVMLKKHSSSQVLPSRSRNLWWKLFLWSHRNLHKPQTGKPQPRAVSNLLKQQGGYSSDTLEPSRSLGLSKVPSTGSFTEGSQNKSPNNYEEDHKWNGFHGGTSGMWPQNQWVAFPMDSSPFARVNEWVKELETQSPPPDNSECCGDHNTEEGIVFPPSPERSIIHLSRQQDMNLSEDIIHANNMIQSLSSSSTVAHISGIGLKAIPTISRFTSLRSVNLSNNFIVCITPGSLPKGLHKLNLSRNKISTIEGLRELTRLRAVDLSYNRISRIGQGLSNCTSIKELYLAGNKISDVEGLHRLLKLSVLELSFNKITTTKALGQLVANYNSLQALNLLGNPIQSNVSEDQLRRAVCGLLPKLVYLNKQPIKPQRAREVVTDSVARAALGTSTSRISRRKAVKRVVPSSAGSISHRSSVNDHKSRSKLKSRTHHLRATSTPLASSSR